MPYTPAGVVSHGFPLEDFTFTYLLSGLARNGNYNVDDVTAAATEGKAVALDTTAASTVKLAGDGDVIFGRVYKAENRGAFSIFTAAIERKFKQKLPAATGHGIAVGDRIVGAGAGLVKKDTANSGAGSPTNPIVIETGTDFVVAEKL